MKTEVKTTLELGFGGRLTIGDHELHCGECFRLRRWGEWFDVRIEHTEGKWRLIGLPSYLRGAAEKYIGCEVEL
jgi:hypothetical protein